MKAIRHVFLTFFFLIGIVSISFGQKIILTQSNELGIYQKGEKIQLEVELNGLEADSLSISIRKNYHKETQTTRIPYFGQKRLIFNEVINEPTALIFEVRVEDEFASLGLVVDPTNFKPGTKRPKDFNKYWKQEKAALEMLKMEVKDIPVIGIEKGYICTDIEINCTGPKPARGYFAKPKNAQPKSLPIVLYVHAAGVKGSWCLSQPENALRYAKMGQGALAFDLNAHGMLNGQPQEYYDELEAGELKGYFYQGIESRESFYFRGMYLRLIRTLDFLTQQPEWDGKRIIVIGESQGGGQALAAAGLDKRVTAVVATVPAMCDWGGPFVDRSGGWPNPFATNHDQEKMLETLPYFDTAHLLGKSKATIVTEIGLIDKTCPSVSIYAAINQNKGKNIVLSAPYRGHHLKQKTYQETWENMIYKPKMDFIEDFLK